MRRGKSLPHVKVVRAKGRTYVYFDTGVDRPNGGRIFARLPDLKTPQFGGAYAAQLGARTRRENARTVLTLAGLVDLYQRSPRYRALAGNTKSIYDTYHNRLMAELTPAAPAGEITRRDLMAVMDKMADKPAAANMMIRAAGALFAWAVDREHLTANPAKDIEQFEIGEHQPWPQHLIDAALVDQDDVVRVAVALLYFTSQRIGDALAMRWADRRDGAIHVTQQKTGKALVVREHQRLTTILAGAPKRGLTILTNRYGRPYSVSAVRMRLQKWAAARGACVVPHGLRKSAVSALLEAGCSVAETAAISGQSLQMIEHYAKQRDSAALGKAAILRWERAAERK